MSDFGLAIDGVPTVLPPEWDATWTEVVGGVGQASVTLQNRVNDDSLDPLIAGDTGYRHLLKMTAGSWVLYEGEIVTPTLDLPVGFPWRRWVLGCTDWNTILDLRIIGAPDGGMWLTTDGGLTFVAFDPSAVNSDTDSDTIHDWFDAYVRTSQPPFGAFDTTKDSAGGFVGTYIPSTVLNPNPAGQPILLPINATLASAFAELAGYGAFPIYGPWIDPDRKVHWSAFPTLIGAGTTGVLGSPAAMGMPAAPAIITDTSPDGVTSIGGRGLKYSFDLTYGPQQVYVVGVTGFAYNGGAVISGGTGWAFGGSAIPSARQILADGQAITAAQRFSIGATYISYSERPQVKIIVTIGGRLDEGGGSPLMDGWRCGQLVTIIDARLPAWLNGRAWPIQKLTGTLKPYRNIRTMTIECGDAAIGRFSQKYRTVAAAKIATPRQPTYTHLVYFADLSPAGGKVQTLTSQMIDSAKVPVRSQGVTVTWSLATEPGGADTPGYLSPTATVTNADGQTQTQFTMPASGRFKVSADTHA
jgi:hypothetical protein